jgi:hypothetical protein
MYYVILNYWFLPRDKFRFPLQRLWSTIESKINSNKYVSAFYQSEGLPRVLEGQTIPRYPISSGNGNVSAEINSLHCNNLISLLSCFVIYKTIMRSGPLPQEDVAFIRLPPVSIANDRYI